MSGEISRISAEVRKIWRNICLSACKMLLKGMWIFFVTFQAKFYENKERNLHIFRFHYFYTILYDHVRDPDPKYFWEVLENSVTSGSLGTFTIQHFLKTAVFQPEDNVPCLVGDVTWSITVTWQLSPNKWMIYPEQRGHFHWWSNGKNAWFGQYRALWNSQHKVLKCTCFHK